MYIEKGVWENIKSYVFHDIKIHGHHLKSDEYVQNYNNVMNQLKQTFTEIYYCLVQYNRLNILKEINVYQIYYKNHVIVTSYSIYLS